MNAHARIVRTAYAVAFLQRLDLHGRHHLTALDPETGEIEARGFAAESWGDIAAWIEARAHLNLYYSVNEPIPGAPHAKLRKEHIARIRAIVADLDPAGATPEETQASRDELLDRAHELADDSEHPPTLTVDSGNGVQFAWILREKLDPAVYRIDAEDLGAGIAHQLDGDAVQNIDRIMRLPGTHNHSAPKKRARGLMGGPVTILDDCSHPDRTYTVEELETEYEPIAGAGQKDRDASVQAAMDGLDWNTAEAGPSAELVARMKADADPYFKGLLAGRLSSAPGDGSGSAWRAALAGAMARKGYELNDYAAVAYVYPPGQPRDGGSVTPRMAARDWARVGTVARDAAPKAETMFGDVSGAEIDTSMFPAPVAETYELAGPKPPRGLKRVPFAEAAKLARETGRRPLVKGLLDLSCMSVIYGDSNVGKTFFILLLAHHIATGTPFAGMRVTKVPVVYVAAEGAGGITLRVEALLRTRGDAPGFDFVLSNVDLFDPNADLEELIALLKAAPIAGLLILDTLARVMAGGDENAVQDMMVVVNHCRRIQEETGCHVMLVHHTGKDASKGARGSSALRGAADTEIEVAPSQIAVTKQRDLPKTWASPFAIKGVDLWKDEDGDQVSAAVAELVASKADVPPGVATAKEQEVLDALHVASETSEDARGGVKVDEVVSVMDPASNPNKGSVRAVLLALQTKRLALKIDRGLWKPAISKAGSVAPEAEARAMFEVILDDGAPDKMSEIDLFG